jgi:hypothetical protein
MSTRAVITIKDKHDTFHIYQHWDGYPRCVADHIAAALDYSWSLPRFDAADFAAAIVAANKKGAGNIYFSKGPDHHADLDYRYEVHCISGAICVDVFSRGNPDGHDKPQRDGESLKGLTPAELKGAKL